MYERFDNFVGLYTKIAAKGHDEFWQMFTNAFNNVVKFLWCILGVFILIVEFPFYVIGKIKEREIKNDSK